MSAEKPTNHSGKNPLYTEPTTSNNSIGDPKSIYSGFINILLKKAYLEGDTLDQVDDEGELAELLAYLSETGLFTPVRLVHSVQPYQIQKLEEVARESPYPPLRSLNQYWVLDARGLEEEELKKIAATLTETFPAVTYAYPEETATAPLLNAINEPVFPEQTHLQAAPTGINAEWVWINKEVFGEGVNLVDLEQNWDLNHLEFANTPPQLEPFSLLNNTNQKHQGHGTAVLGIICAGVNNQGGVGIAPGLDSVRALSHFRMDPNGNRRDGQVADAISSLVERIDSQEIPMVDVLLLEVQRGDGRPTEIHIDNLDAIRLAVSRGIAVIEAAGNAGRNLADFQLGESGAIIVGASKPEGVPLLHKRYKISNYGERVDCFAQGDSVTTIGFEVAGGQRFKGTSAAAAIIAGAAVLLQSVHRMCLGTSLSPDDMRAWLTDPQTGTRQDIADAAKPIGVMPDLENIISSRLPNC